MGREVAARGAVLLCGGLGGVMAAAAQGAQEAGGVSLGILPDGDRRRANPYLTYTIATNLGHARNVLIAHSADALIAVDGSYGTISEAAILAEDSFIKNCAQKIIAMPKVLAVMAPALKTKIPPTPRLERGELQGIAFKVPLWK